MSIFSKSFSSRIFASFRMRRSSDTSSRGSAMVPGPTTVLRLKGCARSEDREVLLDLVVGHVDPVVVPFLPLQVEEVGEHVGAERLAHDLGLLELLKGLFEVRGEGANPELLPLRGGEVVDV